MILASSVVLWLRLHASTAGGADSIPGQGSSACGGIVGQQRKEVIDI